jgi:DNA sulfur modification protein DndC
MQRQAVGQQSLMGLDVQNFDSTFPETTGRYQAPHYNEINSTQQNTELSAPITRHAGAVQEAAIAVLLGLIRKGHSLVCAASFGKDSSCCAVLMIEAVRRAVAEGIFMRHFVTTSSTGVENSALESHALRCQGEIRAFCEEHNLPIEVHTVYPSLASSFVVSTVGRGTLPRTPETGKARACSSSWKVAPQQRLAAELNEQVQRENGRATVTIIGTRLEESASRKERMIARGESATVPVLNKDDHLVLSVVKHWTLDDVWEMVHSIANPENSAYPVPLSPESIERLFTLYRDANEGTCGVILGDGGNRAACGARHGCWNCQIVGDKDKSMESMLTDDKYAYMRPLNDLRNFLVASQNDFETRELIGRTASKAGYIAIRPDVYSYRFRQQLLRYLLSIDADERDRAERMAEDIALGLVDDTPDNRTLASPMFENVSLQQLALVDFHWSLNCFASSAFPALAIWHEVNHLGRRAKVPTRFKAPKIAVPTKRWFAVGNFDHDGIPSEGLRSHLDELWNTHRFPSRTFTHRVLNGERTVWFEEDDNLTIDAEEACLFITCTFPTMFIDVRDFPAIEGARWWLNQGMVKLPKGQAARYQEIAKRNQYFFNLAVKLDLAPDDLNSYLVKNSITNSAHEKLLSEAAAAAASFQHDMFALPLAA